MRQAAKVEPVDVVEAVAEKTKFEVGGRRATYVLIICCLLHAINWMDRQVFSVVAAPMMVALKLTKTGAYVRNYGRVYGRGSGFIMLVAIGSPL